MDKMTQCPHCGSPIAKTEKALGEEELLLFVEKALEKHPQFDSIEREVKPKVQLELCLSSGYIYWITFERANADEDS